MTQERVQKTKATTERKQDAAPVETDTKKVDAEKLKASIDSILDEIDEVLESDAVNMVADFVQKGGQ